MIDVDDFVSRFIKAMEQPDSFVDELLRRIDGPALEEFKNLLIKRALDPKMDLIKTMGNCDALAEIAGKAAKIAHGYDALGEAFAADAFRRFGMHLVALSQRRAEPVKEFAAEYEKQLAEARKEAN